MDFTARQFDSYVESDARNTDYRIGDIVRLIGQIVPVDSRLIRASHTIVVHTAVQ